MCFRTESVGNEWTYLREIILVAFEIFNRIILYKMEKLFELLFILIVFEFYGKNNALILNDILEERIKKYSYLIYNCLLFLILYNWHSEQECIYFQL